MSQPDGAQSGAGEPQSGTAGGPDANATSGTGGSTQSGGAAGEGTTGQQTAPATDAPATVPRTDYDRIREQLSAADKARQTAQDELKQLKDKDLPALEKLNRDLADAQTKAAELEKELRDARVVNAFLSANKHEWHDPEAARKLADLSKVEIDADGTVRGMEDALAALAKSHPYLLKPKKADGDGTGGGSSTTTVTTPPLNNPGGAGSGQASKDQLKTRFPASRTRLG